MLGGADTSSAACSIDALNLSGHAHLLTGEAIMGPLPLTTSNSMPSAGSGVRISLNMITPSGLNASHGCSDSSMAMLAVSERSLNGILSEYLRSRKTHLAWLLLRLHGQTSRGYLLLSSCAAHFLKSAMYLPA
jgi:hypothetical protein